METIREATVEDIEQLMPLLYQLSPLKDGEKEPPLEVLQERLTSIINDKKHFLIVLEQDGVLVGTAELDIQDYLFHACKSCGHLENVVVDKNHRKKGIAVKLVNHLVELAKKNKCYKVILDCVPEIIRVYEKSNFKTTGEVQMRISF